MLQMPENPDGVSTLVLEMLLRSIRTLNGAAGVRLRNAPAFLANSRPSVTFWRSMFVQVRCMFGSIPVGGRRDWSRAGEREEGKERRRRERCRRARWFQCHSVGEYIDSFPSEIVYILAT